MRDWKRRGDDRRFFGKADPLSIRLCRAYRNDEELNRQFEEQIKTIYSDVLGSYFGVVDRSLGVLVYMSDTGDILRVSLTMDEKLSDRITKEQFKQFADRIKETVTMSDYFEVKLVSEGGCFVEPVWVGDRQ